MLLKLHQLGYQGKIRMPVIIQDDSVLIHPAQKVNEEYIAVDLIKVLENIKKSKLEFVITSYSIHYTKLYDNNQASDNGWKDKIPLSFPSRYYSMTRQ